MVRMLFDRGVGGGSGRWGKGGGTESPIAGITDTRVIGSSLSITHAGQIWQSVSFRDEK